MKKKVLVIEDSFDVFFILNCKFFISKKVSKLKIYNFYETEFKEIKNSDKIYTKDTETGDFEIELFNITSLENFSKLNKTNILEFDSIIMDYNLEDGNSYNITKQILKYGFKGQIIPHSDCSNSNEKLIELGAIDIKTTKFSGDAAQVLIDMYTK